MSRRNRERTLRVRFRDDRNGCRSVLVVNSDHKSARRVINPDQKILRVGKVSQQELDKTGEFFPAKQLLDSIRKEKGVIEKSVMAVRP